MDFLSRIHFFLVLKLSIPREVSFLILLRGVLLLLRTMFPNDTGVAFIHMGTGVHILFRIDMIRISICIGLFNSTIPHTFETKGWHFYWGGPPVLNLVPYCQRLRASKIKMGSSFEGHRIPLLFVICVYVLQRGGEGIFQIKGDSSLSSASIMRLVIYLGVCFILSGGLFYKGVFCFAWAASNA